MPGEHRAALRPRRAKGGRSRLNFCQGTGTLPSVRDLEQTTALGGCGGTGLGWEAGGDTGEPRGQVGNALCRKQGPRKIPSVPALASLTLADCCKAL